MEIADKIILTLLSIIIMAIISIWKMIFMEDDFVTVTNVAAFLYIISLTCIVLIWI